jgi:hypothetical protein
MNTVSSMRLQRGLVVAMLSVRVMVILPDCGHVQRSTVAVVVLDAALSTCPGTTYATSTHLWRGERLGAPSDVGRFFFF